MFLKNCWYVAAWPDEAKAQGFLHRRILGEPVLIYRTGGGDPVAMLDRCPHRLVPLSLGEREGDNMVCGYHGMRFGPDGRCNLIPGQDRIPDNAINTVYPLVERHGMLWIWMGDADLADSALIPNVPWPGLSNWASACGYTHMKADYRLLTDNLLDLSHENFIHKNTIGNEDEESIADYPVAVSVVDNRVVRAHRDMPDIYPPPFFKLVTGREDRIDRWQTAIWTVPSINMTDVGVKPSGADFTQSMATRVLHLLTPETKTSSHYFWAGCRSYRLREEELTKGMAEALARTFNEDKEMLERQQEQILEAGKAVPQVALKVDDAPLRARRLLDRMIKLEAETQNAVVATGQSVVPDVEARVPVTHL